MKSTKLYKVMLSGKSTKNSIPVFRFNFGTRKSRRAADLLANKVRKIWPTAVVTIEESNA